MSHRGLKAKRDLDERNRLRRERNQRWLISVAGYGTFVFRGTEAQAEEMRAHKSNWEGGVGKKRLMGRGERWPAPPPGGTEASGK